MVIPVHRARFPDPTGHFETLPQEDQRWMSELIAALQREMDGGRAVAQHEVLLLSPNGKAWRVTVDDAGVVSAANVSMAVVEPTGRMVP